MKMATLIEAQDKGWLLEDSDAAVVHVACPRAGCGLTLTLREGEPIPSCATGEAQEVIVATHEDARRFLRARREQLGLSISDVEHLAGLASSHLLKAEKDNPARKVELDTLTLWANALGYAVALVPAPLHSATLRLIADTRHLQEQRQRTARQAAEVRERKRQAPPALPPPKPAPGLPGWRAVARVGSGPAAGSGAAEGAQNEAT